MAEEKNATQDVEGLIAEATERAALIRINAGSAMTPRWKAEQMRRDALLIESLVRALKAEQSDAALWRGAAAFVDVFSGRSPNQQAR